MGQTRMFRDRVVSMEQTLEGGEKHLPLLKELCREALPVRVQEHAPTTSGPLRDAPPGPDGTPRGSPGRGWSSSTPSDPDADGRPCGGFAAGSWTSRSAARPEIVVTFRHLEELGDTPEPRREAWLGGRRGGRPRGSGGAGEWRPPGPSGPRLGRRPCPSGRAGAATRFSASAADPGPRQRPGQRCRCLRRRRRGGEDREGSGKPFPRAAAGPDMNFA
jgi:hypothetical protein